MRLQANTSRRQQLLNSAARLILDQGVGKLTLEAVCEAARVSKGGLLYYFESKTALLEALVDDLAAQLQGEVDGQLHTSSTDGVSGARAYLRAVVRMGELPRTQQLCKALTFICAAHPEFVDRIRSRAKQRSVFCSARNLSLEELHLRLLADGLWLADIYECYQITPERRMQLLELCGCADSDVASDR
ncbi:TetR/AcrR family transcriptional regulator [Steroidobacter cummioxidans]|uniref:TetR/AcrR family transcriptional regulator n=1 Tax=Steroidobacter cummioxidans TaxID=1803913 RepID=UPI000E3201CC|nr:TetR/AcrR family transcriptional regulator [Steroidobacter cummioxidans]